MLLRMVMSYILDFNKVQPGDIVISSGTTIGAQVIKLGTWSKDTHSDALCWSHNDSCYS